MKEGKFIQIGITALRDPKTGGFLPAVPLYIEADESATEAETAMHMDIGRVFAEKMKQYIDGGGIIERRGNLRTERSGTNEIR